MQFLESHVRALYRLLNHGNEFSDCRCIDINNPGNKPISRELLKGEESFVGWAKANNGKGNCFVGRNPRAQDGSVSRITSYTLDLDPPHAPRTSVPSEMVAAAVMAGRAILQVWPSGYLAESGNGALVLYRLAMVVDKNLEAFKEWLVNRGNEAQKLLASRGLGDIICDNTHDNARIIKIPGTMSVKGAPDNWRLARFVEVPCAPYRQDSWLNAPNQRLPSTSVNGMARNATGWVTDALKNLKDGNRNQSFTRIAGKLVRERWTREEIISLLSPHAEAARFDLRELQAVVDSTMRYGEGTPPDASCSIDSFLADEKKVEWICEPFFAKGAICFIAGLPETMKTWMLADLAIECARDAGEWLGLFNGAPTKALFIDQERFRSETQRRLKAMLKAKGLEPSSLKERLFVRCGTTTRLDLEPSFQAFRATLGKILPGLVIVDSFATFHTQDDNNRTEIQTVMERIKALRDEFGCAFVFVDHENKGAYQAQREGEPPSSSRMAGSVAKSAAAESILTVRRHDSSTSSVWHTKSTLGKASAQLYVRVQDEPDGGISVKGDK